MNEIKDISLLSWKNFKLIIKQYLNIDFIKIDDFFRKNTKWYVLNDWLNVDDLVILNCLESLYTFEGVEKLIVITDASYLNNLGPFVVETS